MRPYAPAMTRVNPTSSGTVDTVTRLRHTVVLTILYESSTRKVSLQHGMHYGFFSLDQTTRTPKAPRMTAVSFSADDLAALGHLVAVGQAVLQKRPPVVARLKAAMTRMGVPLPDGL